MVQSKKVTAVLVDCDVKSCLLRDQQLYDAFTNGVIHIMNEL